MMTALICNREYVGKSKTNLEKVKILSKLGRSLTITLIKVSEIQHREATVPSLSDCETL